MRLYQLRSTQNGKILYQGEFKSFQSMLEQTARDKTPVPYADMKHRNLSNADLDGLIAPHGDFSGSNLTGANISESYLNNSNFSGCALYNACLCESSIANSNFDGAFFGGTDIYDSLISHSQFSTLSAFSLDFQSVKEMKDCVFINANGRISKMSKPPIVIMGMRRSPTVFLDDTVKLGHNIIDRKRLQPLMEKLSTRLLKRKMA